MGILTRFEMEQNVGKTLDDFEREDEMRDWDKEAEEHRLEDELVNGDSVVIDENDAENNLAQSQQMEDELTKGD